MARVKSRERTTKPSAIGEQSIPTRKTPGISKTIKKPACMSEAVKKPTRISNAVPASTAKVDPK